VTQKHFQIALELYIDHCQDSKH